MGSYLYAPDEIKRENVGPREVIEDYGCNMCLCDMEPAATMAHRITGDVRYMQLANDILDFCTGHEKVIADLMNTISDNPGEFLLLGDLWGYDDIQWALEALAAEHPTA